MLVEDLPAWSLRLVWFVWGALWGSFFNVAIHRWPRGMSVVTPPSHCPSCGAPIPGWRNVPILAYIFQRGRAGCCGAKLTPRYLVVEVLSGLLAVAVAERFVLGSPGDRALYDASIEALVYFAFVGGLVIATFVDIEHMQIPDEVSLGGAALGLATVSLREGVDVTSVAVGGGAAYLVTMLVPVWAWERMTGQRGMGEGDAKLLLCIGTFLGWQGVLFVIAAASLQGTIGYFVQLAWQARHPAATEGEAAPSIDDPPADDDVDLVEVRGEDQLTAELEVDLPGKVVARARRAAPSPAPSEEAPADGDPSPDGLVLELEYRLDSFAPSAPHIRFGPFLALGALEFLFFGQRIVDWYIETFFMGV